MRYDWLLEPVSATQPCGPDLDEAGDDAYLDYVLTASSRIPARYYRADPFSRDKDTPFDRNSIQLADEIERIGALLRETRDLRLLALEARFQSFAGELSDFSDTVVAMGELTGRFWDEVHPQGLADGDPDGDGKDFTLRQNVLGGLDDFWQIVQPLQHLPIVVDKRLGPISYRLYAAASGAAPKRPDDPPIDAAQMLRALGEEENRGQTDAAHAAIGAAAAALGRIRDAFVENSGHDYLPNFDRLSDTLDKMAGLIRTARPDLVPAAPEPQAEDETADETAEGADAPIAVAAPAPKLTGRIRTHADAAAALLAVETYFAATEPTSPALILVHQARLLVGKPLVHAIETLMPEIAGRVVIRFPAGLDFKIPMTLMKSLTDKVAIPPAPASAEAAPAYAAATREEATTLLAEVEYFFRTAEPSSPIPVLLARANGFTNWKFDMILKDLIAPVV